MSEERLAGGLPGQFLGIEIGGTKLQLVAGDGNGIISQRRRLVVDRAAGGEGIRRQIEQSLPEFVESGLLAAGVGFGGPVNWKTGQIHRSHHLTGWESFALGSWLATISGIPTFVDNDANVAALAEAMLGAGAGFDPVFYVTLGSGVGGGLVTGNAIYHGATPGEAEVGHLRIDRSGAILESRCAGWSVDARLRTAVQADPTGTLAQLVGSAAPGGEARHLGRALSMGDPLAQTILAEVAADLAHGLSHVVHLFHPEAIVIGGGLSLIGEPLRAAVADQLSGAIMKVFAPGPEVRLAALGEDAVPVGALLLAQQRSAA